jgi:ankyrin repeat protein
MPLSKEDELMHALLLGEEDIFVCLLNNGADVNCAGGDGATPLYQAICLNKINFVRILLADYNVDVNIADIFGSTPLHIAARREDQKLMQAIIDKKAILDNANDNGVTPFIESVKNSHFDIAKFFLDSGADVNAVIRQDDYSQLCNSTALHIAAMEGDLQMITLLVSYGADIGATSLEGYTPRELFIEDHQEMTAEQFDVSVATALDSIEKNKRTIALSIEFASDSAQLPQLPTALVLLMADYVGGYGKALNASHLSGGLVLNNIQPSSASQSNVAPDENKEGKEQDSALDSSANTPAPGGDRTKASSSAEQPSDQQESTESEHNTEETARYKEVGDVDESGKALLMKLLSWIKDLPEALQEQVLHSSSMNPLLELLETITQPSKFITDLLCNQPIEENFAAEFQNHYGKHGLYKTTSEDDALVSQYDPIIALDETIGTISSDGILIDHLPKHDINFGASYILASLAS